MIYLRAEDFNILGFYSYSAKKGEMETLQEKRELYIQNHNES